MTESAMDQPIDTSICPLCGKDNGCMAQSHESCWCNEVVVPAALIALVPVHLQRQACICRSCIELFHLDPDHFTACRQD